MGKGLWQSLWKYLLLEVVVLAVVLGAVYNEQMRNRLYEAEIYGESVASHIELSLNQYVGTVEELGDQYVEYGDEFAKHFPSICKRIMGKDDVIGSLYIAPKGVISLAYPEEVNAATIGFEPAADPEQGAATRFAIDSKKTTVAGPHALVEGGTGFIVRYPIYTRQNGDDRFVGLAILVMDWDKFVAKVTDDYSEQSRYRFAVWKDQSDHVLVDEDGYIFKNGPVSQRKLDIAIDAPNDSWHLTVEEMSGWGSFLYMLPWIMGAALVLVGLTIFEVSVIRDRENRRRLQYAEAANEAKSTFLFNMSHDIRTPMNSVIGFTRLAMQHEDDPALVHEYLSKILVSGNHLLTLINDILEMSRIESGKVELNEEACSLHDLLDDLASMMEEQVSQKDIRFEAYCDSVSFDRVYCDKLRINQVLINLLSNAVKFTPNGGSVSVSVHQPKGAKGHAGDVVPCEFCVKDTGIGMSEEFASKLFDAFERENTSTVSGTQGTGLGTTITKRLVEMMGGRIHVETNLGRGTKFTVVIPLRIAGELDTNQAEELQPSETASPSEDVCGVLVGKRVLMVEDIEINRLLAREVLESFGLEVDEVDNGQKAVEAIDAAPANTYDVVLMDIQMPVMDGYEATRAIRALPDKEKAQVPIIAMTANAFEDDRRNSREAGMNGHIAKPFDFDELRGELSRWV